jgi:hypothetical protein
MNQHSKARQKTITFHYKFTLSDGNIKEFDVELDSETLSFTGKKKRSYPEWTRLPYRKCPNCPLSDAQNPQCPIAANLVDVVEFFKDSVSHEEVDVEITTEARRYVNHTALQSGISSLIGIYMVTSGCPVMDKLRPMVRTHLPFATGEETMYRALSMYLLAQYFVYKRGQRPDWDLENLAEIYEEIGTVNKSFCQRLTGTNIQDAILNAMVTLDCFAMFTDNSIRTKNLAEIEHLFHAYLDSESPKQT